MPNSSGLVGAEVAAAILQENGLTACRVETQPGKLTDHYDPRVKAVRLSPNNFGVASVASRAIAARESGQALQDAGGYVPLRIRSALLPIATLGAQ